MVRSSVQAVEDPLARECENKRLIEASNSRAVRRVETARWSRLISEDEYVEEGRS